MKPSAVMLLFLCGCAVAPKPPTPPPALRNLAANRIFTAPAAPAAVVVPPRTPAIYWEHSGEFTSGFVVERMEVDAFAAVGFVPVASPWATNESDFTFRYELTNEPSDRAFYRVGAVPLE